jgi:hypothetical protein
MDKIFNTRPLLGTTSQITPGKDKDVSKGTGGESPSLLDAKVVGGNRANGVGGDLSTQVKRDDYVVYLSCLDGSWQNPSLPATSSLSDAECSQLYDLIFKMLDNGVLLGVTYAKVKDVLSNPDLPK